MLLNDLPADVLREIFRGANSHLALEVWKCGDLQLQRILANHGVEEMSLIDKKPFSIGRWPRILKHLQLRSLTIESTSPLGSDEMVRKELFSQNTSLQRLSLNFLGAAEAVLGLSRRLAAEAPPPAKRAKRSRATAAHTLIDRYEPLSARFTCLEHLEIIDETRLLSNAPQREHWSTLPPSLTSLVVGLHSITEFAGLPSNVTRIRFDDRIGAMSSKLVPTLPSTVVQLDFLDHDGKKLLKNLLSAEKSGKGPVLNPFPLTCFNDPPQLALIRKHGRWPKNIKELSLPQDYLLNPANATLRLPPELTDLSLWSWLHRGHHVDSDLRQTNLSWLPNTLTSFEAPSIDWNAIKRNPNWLPQTLTDFRLHNDTNFRILHFPLLPRKLKSLYVPTYAYIPRSIG